MTYPIFQASNRNWEPRERYSFFIYTLGSNPGYCNRRTKHCFTLEALTAYSYNENDTLIVRK